MIGGFLVHHWRERVWITSNGIYLCTIAQTKLPESPTAKSRWHRAPCIVANVGIHANANMYWKTRQCKYYGYILTKGANLFRSTQKRLRISLITLNEIAYACSRLFLAMTSILIINDVLLCFKRMVIEVFLWCEGLRLSTVFFGVIDWAIRHNNKAIGADDRMVIFACSPTILRNKCWILSYFDHVLTVAHRYSLPRLIRQYS